MSERLKNLKNIEILKKSENFHTKKTKVENLKTNKMKQIWKSENLKNID